MRKNFTLIEMIICIVVLGVIASIVIPNISNLRGEAIQTSLTSNINNLQKAVDFYMMERGEEIPAYSQPYLGNPQILNPELLNPDYVRNLPREDGINYWVDYEGFVWGSPIDAPTGVLSNADTGETNWVKVKGAKSYNIYEVQEKNIKSSINNNGKLVLVDNVKSSPYIGEVGKVYAVSSIDHKGNESPPVTEIYRGVTEMESGYMEFNSNLEEEYREFLMIRPKQDHIENISGEGWIYWRGDDSLERNGSTMGIFGVATTSNKGNIHFEITEEPDTTSQVLRMRLGEADFFVRNVINPNEWTHVGFTYNSDEIGSSGEKGVLRVYVNGIEVGKINKETDVLLKDRFMTIGDSQYRPEADSNKRPFNGRIRDFRVWEKALTAEEIKEIASDMEEEFTGAEKGLFGYWQLYRPLGDVVLDLSKYKNHAQIVGNPYVQR